MIKQQLSKFSVTTALLFSTITLMSVSTNIPTVSADDTITPIDDTITITVDSACTMGQTVLQSSNTLNPGETSTIGGSRIAAYCNDSEGYAIYAIGYTNGEYGNTNLVSTQNPSHIIPTGISGTDSYWNMKLTGGTATGPVSYQPTMVNTFTTNTNIPNDYTKVAYRDSSTISQTEDPTETGSYFTTTYETHLSTTQPAGIYNGQVQYVMVHPSGGEKPEKPETIDTITDMQIFAALSKRNKARVLGSMNQDQQYTLTDGRDGKTYYIAKLADGNIWMTQNLDLDLDSSKTYTSTDTDLPEGTTWRPSTSTHPTNDTSWGRSDTPQSYDPGNLYWNGEFTDWWDGTIYDMTTDHGDPHYHIGNYYNWHAAIASNSKFIGSSNQSICPAGWQLPSYGDNDIFQNLISAQDLTSGRGGNIQNTPTYFVYGGFWTASSYGSSKPTNSYSVGSRGTYWTNASPSPYNTNSAYALSFDYNGYINAQSSIDIDSGNFIRCIAR